MLDDIGEALFTFDSVEDMKQSTAVVVGQKVHTLGYYTPGDGGGNDYEIVAAGTGEDDGGSFINLAGSGTQAKGLFPQRIVTDNQFAGDNNEALGFARDLLDSEKNRIYANLVDPTGALKISQFLTDSSDFGDDTVALQSAVNELLSSTRYRSLDLEGRLLPVTSPIVVDEDLVGTAFNTPNIIMNGAITANSDWTGTTSDPILRYQSTAGNRIERHVLFGVNLMCNKRASGAGFYGDKSHNCRFVMCNVMDPADFGISTVNGPGNGHYVINTNIVRYDSTTPFENRVTVGVDLGEHNDTKIIGCNIQYCKHGIYSRGTSHQIIGNHIYQGEETGVENTGYNAGIVFRGGRVNSVITGNYIDNCHILIGDGTAATPEFMGYASITNNIFTMKDAGSDEFVLAMLTANPNSIPSNIIFTGNQIRKFGDGGFMAQPLRLQTTGSGSWNKINAGNIQVSQNYWWGDVQAVSSQIVVRQNTNGTDVTYPVDLASMSPFGLWPANFCFSTGFQSSGRANRTFVTWNRVSNTSGNIELDTSAEGTATVTLSVCRNIT